MVGPRTCHSPRRNLPPGDEDELIGSLLEAPNEGSNTPTHSRLFLRLWLPLRPLLMNCSNNSWKLTWSLIKDLTSLQQSANNLLKLKCRMYIIMNCTWTVITSGSSAKIILRSLGPLEPTKSSLQLLFFGGISAYDRCSLNVVEVRK